MSFDNSSFLSLLHTVATFDYINRNKVLQISNILHKEFPSYEFIIEHEMVERPDQYKVLIVDYDSRNFERVLYLDNCFVVEDIISQVVDFLTKNKNDDNVQLEYKYNVKTKIFICPNCGAVKNSQDSICDYCGTVFR